MKQQSATRHPNQRSTWDTFQGTRRTAEDPKNEYVSLLVRDLAALEEMQKTRPQRIGQASLPTWLALYGKRVPYKAVLREGNVILT